jgi:hypothetical protein
MKRAPKQHEWWECFSRTKTESSGGSIKVLQESFVSIQLPTQATLRDVLEAIGRQCNPPIAIASLDETFAAHRCPPRGVTIFGNAGDRINDIVSRHDGLHWWISAVGLNVAGGPMNAATMSAFDELAGTMYFNGSEDGVLSKEVLLQIAEALDKAGFSLKELQPAQRKPIIEHNRKYAKVAIKTFVQAARHSRFARCVSRRLYVARDRYKKANTPRGPVS